MKKVMAFVMFMHHYWSYQIPMKLMKSCVADVLLADEDNDTKRFVESSRGFLKWAEKVAYHQERCDHYKAIIES